MASFATNKGLHWILGHDMSAATILLIVVDAAPASQAAAADLNYVSDIVADEVSGAGYARRTLTSLSLTENDTADRAELDAADPATYSAMDVGTIAGAWTAIDTGGSDGTRVLIGFHDFTDLVTNTGDVTLQIPTGGFLHLIHQT